MIEIIEKTLQYGKDSYAQYKGTGAYFTLFIIAVIAIYFFRPERSEPVGGLKNKRISERAYTVYYPLLAFLLIFSPIVAGPIVHFITAAVYWRIFWIIPMPLIIALAMAMLVMKVPAGVKRFLAVIGCAVVIWVSGSLIVNSNNYQKAANWFKLPYEVIEICETIRQDNDGYVNVAVPYHLSSYIRQYDASINMPYGRHAWGAHTAFVPKLAEDAPNIEEMKVIIDKFNINYFVIYSENPANLIFPEWCELIGVSGKFYVLRVVG